MATFGDGRMTGSPWERIPTLEWHPRRRRIYGWRGRGGAAAGGTGVDGTVRGARGTVPPGTDPGPSVLARLTERRRSHRLRLPLRPWPWPRSRSAGTALRVGAEALAAQAQAVRAQADVPPGNRIAMNASWTDPQTAVHERLGNASRGTRANSVPWWNGRSRRVDQRGRGLCIGARGSLRRPGGSFSRGLRHRRWPSSQLPPVTDLALYGPRGLGTLRSQTGQELGTAGLAAAHSLRGNGRTRWADDEDPLLAQSTGPGAVEMGSGSSGGVTENSRRAVAR